MQVAIAHDYLTQRGGAERVVISMAKAFPDAPIYTSLYDPLATFDSFRELDVRPTFLDRLPPLRRNHRAALPLLAPAFSALRIEADCVLASSSGWAHGVSAAGKKVVYCYSPARWLYQPNRYLGDGTSAAKVALAALRRPLRRWDAKAARSASRYLTLSRSVQAHIRDVYGFDAEIIPPPFTIDPTAASEAVAGLGSGFFLCVSRLLPYKNVDAVVAAFSDLSHQLVVVGRGPLEEELRRTAPPNVQVLGGVSEEQLRWLYGHCKAVVAASYEDYGLTPLEALAFDKPSVALAYGGFLDTIVPDETGVFFDRPTPKAIASGIARVENMTFAIDRLRNHRAQYSEPAFIERIRAVVAQEVLAD